MKVVEQMEKAYLVEVPKGMLLSSTGVRRRQCTMGTFLCSLLRDGLRNSGRWPLLYHLPLLYHPRAAPLPSIRQAAAPIKPC